MTSRRTHLGIAATAVLLMAVSGVVLAATKPDLVFVPEQPIPGFETSAITGLTIANYLRAVFVWAVGAIMVAGVAMVVFGGVRWIVAAGDSSQINAAKDIVQNAVIGIIIALTTVLLLNLISPELTALKSLALKQIVGNEFQELIPYIEKESKDIQFICLSTDLKGPPDTAYTLNSSGQKVESPEAKNNLNEWIRDYSRKAGVDPVLVKAIMAHESTFISQPTRGADGTNTKLLDGSMRRGSAYGLAQFQRQTLASVMKRVWGSVPQPECPLNSEGKITRESNGSLIKSCQAWMDAHLKVQVQMIVYHLMDLQYRFRKNANPKKLTVAAYHVGETVAEKFDKNATTSAGQLSAADRAGIIQYLRAVQTQYAKICAQSPEATPPAGARSEF